MSAPFATLDTEEYLDAAGSKQTGPTLEAARADADRLRVRVSWSRLAHSRDRIAEFDLSRDEFQRMLALLDAG